MPAPPPIEIALAVKDGARFLPELLDSLFAQTVQDFTVLVADDGSSDTSMAVVRDFAARHPGRIIVLEFPEPAGGATPNFGRIIDALSAPYAMFCDQDDIWLPNKIELSLSRLRAMETQHGEVTPLLFYTDLSVVDSDLNPLGDSFWAYCRIKPANNDFQHLLMRNVAAGCSMIVNRACYGAARPTPRTEIMYDSWIGLVAAGLGHVGYTEQRTILYRQHNANAIGAQPWNLGHILRRAAASFTGENAAIVHRKAQGTALFVERYADRLGPADRAAALALAELPLRSRPRRLWDWANGRFRMWTLATQLGLVFALLGSPRPRSLRRR